MVPGVENAAETSEVQDSPHISPLSRKPMTKTRVRTVWTAEEDALLLKRAQESIPHKWSEIAKELPGRTPLQCRQRWLNSLDPSIKKGAWTEEEDGQLASLRKIHGGSWATICKKMDGRTSQQCRYRWVSALDPSLNHGAWTVEEDETLYRLHCEHGNAWSKIASHMNGRTDLQCRYRWVFGLDASMVKFAWTSEEDAALLAMHRKFGNSWAKIANQLPARTSHQCKYRFNSFLGNTAKKRARPADDGDNTVPTSPESMVIGSSGDHDSSSADAAGSTGTSGPLFGNAVPHSADAWKPNISSGALKKRFLKRWASSLTDTEKGATGGIRGSDDGPIMDNCTR